MANSRQVQNPAKQLPITDLGVTDLSYQFRSNRLGFRNWIEKDVLELSLINLNAQVMEFFPSTWDYSQTLAFIERMQHQFAAKGYCYFAVDELSSGRLIGFIGLSDQVYEAEYTPCTDIGWRIHPEFWNKGYATEGAKACLDYGFKEINLKEILAVTPQLNWRSEKVMKSIGMKLKYEFKHPHLKDFPHLEDCFLYSIKSKNLFRF